MFAYLIFRDNYHKMLMEVAKSRSWILQLRARERERGKIWQFIEGEIDKSCWLFFFHQLSSAKHMYVEKTYDHLFTNVNKEYKNIKTQFWVEAIYSAEWAFCDSISARRNLYMNRYLSQYCGHPNTSIV